MDMSILANGAADEGNRVNGRPLGLLMAWLKEDAGTKIDHNSMKRKICKPEHFKERRFARRDLWQMRFVNLDILEGLSVERPDIVPAEFEQALELYEPWCAF